MSDLFSKYNIPVPRYTSYPTAAQFHDRISPADTKQWLTTIEQEEGLSLYVHIPFCRKLCFYCGCSMKVVNNEQRIVDYLNLLHQEIRNVANLLGTKRRVSHLHFGGGTPTVLTPKQFGELMQELKANFDFSSAEELAIEIDPRTLSAELCQTMAEHGITRASLGVQDFDPNVQKAINRVQPYEMVKKSIEDLKNAGITNLNLDLIYGLPLQTSETIAKSIELAMSLQPTRIALFGYAHVPWMKKHQQVLEKYHLPTPAERQEMFDLATKLFKQHGLISIGYDHFAHPDDQMAIADKNGELHRNFQGFTTDSATTLIGFGASAISTLPDGYAQNDASISGYMQRIEEQGFATMRGVAVTTEDKSRRDVMEQLMCNYTVTTELSITNPNLLTSLIADKMVEKDQNTYRATAIGKPFVRLLAACFDTYWKPQEGKHARAV